MNSTLGTLSLGNWTLGETPSAPSGVISASALGISTAIGFCNVSLSVSALGTAGTSDIIPTELQTLGIETALGAAILGASLVGATGFSESEGYVDSVSLLSIAVGQVKNIGFISTSTLVVYGSALGIVHCRGYVLATTYASALGISYALGSILVELPSSSVGCLSGNSVPVGGAPTNAVY